MLRRVIRALLMLIYVDISRLISMMPRALRYDATLRYASHKMP